MAKGFWTPDHQTSCAFFHSYNNLCPVRRLLYLVTVGLWKSNHKSISEVRQGKRAWGVVSIPVLPKCVLWG